MKKIISELRKLIFIKLLGYALDILPEESPFYKTYASFLSNNLDREI